MKNHFPKIDGEALIIRALGFAVAGLLLLAGQPLRAERVTLSPGVQIAVRMDEALSTRNHYFGPIITETLEQDVLTADGRVAIPAGTKVKLAVAEFKRAGHLVGRSKVRLRLYSIVAPDGSEVPLDGYPVRMDNGKKPDKEGTFHGKRSLVKDAAVDMAAMGAGAGAGMAVGGPLGLPVGAGAGVLTAGLWTAARRGPDLQIPAGTVISFALDRPASIVLNDSDRSAGGSSPSNAWGLGLAIPPSADLVNMLDDLGDPQSVLKAVDHLNYRNRPDSDRVFVQYLRGVCELKMGHPRKALPELKAAYDGAAKLGLPGSARAEIARNLVIALKSSSKDWEESPLLEDAGVQAALVEPVGGGAQ